MPEQLPLFDQAGADEPATIQERFGWAASRNSDPDTSAAAASSIRGEKANALESKVLDMVKAHPDGLTGQEVTDLLGLDRVTTSPRFAPLKRKGLIYDSGERRSGPSNRPAIVWKERPPHEP